MDLDTAILLALTGCAYILYVSLGIFEQKKEINARREEEIYREKQARRINKLFGRS